MAEATEQELKDMLSATAELSADSLSLVLADAKITVISHGFAETDSRFSQLQRYQAAHLLSIMGLAGQKITSESVGDVSINFADNPGALGTLYSTEWEKMYQMARVNIQGMTDRFL